MFDVKVTRPKNFVDYVGNKDNVNLLKLALKEGFPPFTLMIGPTGVGKTTISKIIAKQLTCKDTYDGVACGVCEDCFNADNSLIDNDKDTSNIMVFRMCDEGGKRAARKVQDQINTRSLNGGTKVIILEECQGMSSEAQELLLPALENLKDHVRVIACTTDARALLPTLKGRSSPYYFKQPTVEEIIKLLERTTHEQGYKVDSHLVFQNIVEVAGRTPRDCLQLFQKISAYGKDIHLKDVIVHLNVVDETFYLEFLEILRGDIGLVLDFIDRVENSHSSLTDFMKGLDAFLVKLVTLRYRVAHFSESVGLRAKNYLKDVGEDKFLQIQSIISDNSPLFYNHPNPKSALISLVFKIKDKEKIKLGTVPQAKAKVTQQRDAQMNALSSKLNQYENSTPVQLSANALLSGTKSTIIRRPSTENGDN